MEVALSTSQGQCDAHQKTIASLQAKLTTLTYAVAPGLHSVSKLIYQSYSKESKSSEAANAAELVAVNERLKETKVRLI